jgi:hypothetical protein
VHMLIKGIVFLQIQDLKFSPGFVVSQGVVVCTLPHYIPKWQVMFAPFRYVVWIGACISFPIGIFAIKIIQHVLRMTIVESGGRKPQFLNWIYLVGLLMQRPSPISRIPQRWTFIICVGTWIIFGFMLSICYSNILTGVLTLPPHEDPIDSLKDLLNSDKPWTVTGLIEEVKLLKILSHSIINKRFLLCVLLCQLNRLLTIQREIHPRAWF